MDLPCANDSSQGENCKEKGVFTCDGCHLLLYCGRACQKQHWARHKQYCQSLLKKMKWKPEWEVEGRTPAFIGGGPAEHFGGMKYLWGNVPALGVLNLSKNEGNLYDKNLRILFAASGDIRNAVQTVASVASGFSKPISITMNDKNFDIVARNAIMLLIAFVVEDVDKAVDCVIHVWYSALLRFCDMRILIAEIRPLLEEMCTKIANKPSGSLLAKTWTFGARRLRLVLAKEAWLALLKHCGFREGLTVHKADRIRTATTLAAQRRDYKERYYAAQTPAHRVSLERYREDGILLPFGCSREPFKFPNPTLYPDANNWPLPDSANPVDGWDVIDVTTEYPGTPTSDLFGKLYFYIRARLKEFHHRAKSLDVDFQLLNVDAQGLRAYLGEARFDRIDVSNICDDCYLGFEVTLACLSPLLQSKAANPKATMIMLFMNVLDKEVSHGESVADVKNHCRDVAKYLPPPRTMAGRHRHDSLAMSYIMATQLFRDVDKYFNRIIGKRQMEDAGRYVGMVMKENHTIVDKWPTKLKKKHLKPGAQEEFNLRNASGHSVNERYVEWQRAE